MFARIALWSALAFLLNLAWETAHVRLYTLWDASSGPVIAAALFHCSLGDMLIALAMYAVAGLALRRADWPAARPWAGSAIVVVGATAFTAWSEGYNVYGAGNWAYSASMPLIFGLGLSPLVQWIVLPPAIVLACRTMEPSLQVARATSAPISAHERLEERT